MKKLFIPAILIALIITSCGSPKMIECDAYSQVETSSQDLASK